MWAVTGERVICSTQHVTSDQDRERGREKQQAPVSTHNTTLLEH